MPDSKNRRPVVLLHGLARTHRSMGELALALEAAGFTPRIYAYPSRDMTIQEAADFVGRRIASDVGGEPLYAVTHSLGGIVLRHIREKLDWRRIVMIAPPNKGSTAAAALQTGWDFLAEAFKRVTGPAGGELGRAAEVDRPFPFPPAPFAIIAGTRPVSVTSALTGRVFPDGIEHDGVVSVDETKIMGMADFMTISVGHTDIVSHPMAIQQAIRFLERGSFTGVPA